MTESSQASRSSYSSRRCFVRPAAKSSASGARRRSSPSCASDLDVLVRRSGVRGDRERRDLQPRVDDDPGLDACGDRHRVRHGLGRPLPEGTRHLGAALHVELGVVELHPLRVVQRLPHADAEEDVLRGGVVAGQVVGVVRRHGRDAGLLREPEEVRQDLPLLREAVVHHLDEVAVLAEEVVVLQGRPLRPAVVARPEPLGDLRVQASRERDEPRVVLLEELPVHPRLVVEAGQVRLRDEVRQVAVPLGRLREKREVVVVPLAVERPHGFAVEARARRDVGLDAEDRLHARLERRRLELVRAEHVPVVGDGDGVHPEVLHLMDQVLDAVGAVQEGVLGVQVEMNEVGGHPARILVPRGAGAPPGFQDGSSR